MLVVVDYTIIQKPDRVTLECPYCGEEIEMPVSEFKDVFEATGDTIECPECKGGIELGGWELD
ncbi:hypothetical protein HB943_02080 [Listeria weihenstephanensis]|uniref:DPH-type MB domain-containing protein n=1 Tax=Listeria weihenstephanensis TaxID=1006155 RepID=A0A841Z2D3_9LIST|nr:hypothetical protein [Listeria weihenstephanensis]MBC1499375.1 hypothetical protein [Listeria weihenstephanensis]